MNVGKIYDYIDSIAPFSAQEEWDNSGLQVGSRDQDVKKVLVGLDATAELVEEAKLKQCDLIISHHPFIFNAVKSFVEPSPAFLAAKYNISVISAHTSFDCAVGGVNDVLAELVGVYNTKLSENKLFRIGRTDSKTVRDFAQTVKNTLNADVFCSLPEKEIKTVAVCGGSAAEYIEAAKNEGADVFLTGEVKHHEILDACDLDIAVVCSGHFETEAPSMRVLTERLQKQFPEITFILSEQTSPIYHI
ncbi:MAG: Nif3-like dinuclear metal center hexameric protein [Candidatus Fimenecus sp.]